MKSDISRRHFLYGACAVTLPTGAVWGKLASAAPKAALVSLIRTVARENGDRGITANVVLPGTMDTPANRASDPTADFSKWVNPCQVASLLVHLASSRASNINGAVIPVYGTEA